MVSKWNVKYYKGLSTSTAKEAKEYLSNIDSHCIRPEGLEVINIYNH